MQERFKDQVQFVCVYLREAHPKGGWEMSDWSVLADPASHAERMNVAAHGCKELKFDFPVVVDTMDDATAVRWCGWPERLFLITMQGRIAYTGEMGPFGFNPSIAYPGYDGEKAGICLEEFLDAYIGKPDAKAASE